MKWIQSIADIFPDKSRDQGVSQNYSDWNDYVDQYKQNSAFMRPISDKLQDETSRNNNQRKINAIIKNLKYKNYSSNLKCLNYRLEKAIKKIIELQRIIYHRNISS